MISASEKRETPIIRDKEIPQTSSIELTQRQRNEKAHYDELYGNHPRDSQGQLVFPSPKDAFAAVSGLETRPHNQDWEFLREIKELNLQGKTLLEIGCGTGAYVVQFAHLGAKVVAFDLSSSAIEVGIERARYYGLEDRITYNCTSAESMDYPDETFDVIVGSYILHHIEVEAAAKNIYRMLKPGGVAIFLEWVAWGPFDSIRSLPLVQKFFPPGDGDVTADERKLGKNDRAVLRRYFKVVTERRFWILVRLTYFFPSTKLMLEKADLFLQRFLPIGKAGGAAIIRMEK
jgi:2-polyprenyl-3-methyl-5-hydroxy-6-metoxy-1,4-benzoquinol methylase